MSSRPLRPHFGRRRWAGLLQGAMIAAGMVAADSTPAVSEPLVDAALAFYERGGAYCFRVAPLGVSLSEETEWTVMLLTSASNRRQSYRIRTVDPGDSGLKGPALQEAARAASEVWRIDRVREEFFERFAHGIRRGSLRARVVNAAPATLARVESERQRAEMYLRFADRGSRVSFDRGRDLSADEFQQFADYFPD